jgi:hypothetical protein
MAVCTSRLLRSAFRTSTNGYRKFMPAINLPRLKLQAAELAELFDQPEAFLHSLNDLLDLYADRVHRYGQAGDPPPLIQAYHVPPPMLRQLALELNPYAAQDTAHTLALCDLLWGEPLLEPRLLAAMLLGQAPLTPADRILERVGRWAQPIAEDRLINALVQQGLSRVSREQPQRLLQQSEGWLTSDDTGLQRLGLRALLLLASDPGFDNLPAILHQLLPFVRAAPFPVRADVMDVLIALARRSPKETAYTLRQSLEAPDHPETAWLVRQALRYFPAETQASLRAALRKA